MAPAPCERSPLEGYAEQTSYLPGETVTVHCSSEFATFSAEVARVGGERSVIWRTPRLEGTWHEAPAAASATGCGWPASFHVALPEDAPSGYYEIVLVGPAAPRRTHEHVAYFVVRPGRPRNGPILLVLSTNTYNAYNDWGGLNLYTGGTRVSFRRPMAPGFLRKPDPYVRYPNIGDLADPEHEQFRSWASARGLSRWSGSAGWHNWERTFVAWAEREGFDLDIAASSDLERHPEVLDGHRLVVSVGHDEYWSWPMRDSLEAFISGGGNAAFFSGNAVFWQVRLEEDGAVMVCHKSASADPHIRTEHRGRLTTMWSAAVVGRPENQLTGVSFTRGGYVRMGRAVPRSSGGYTVWRPQHWVFEGTGLSYGDVVGARDSIVAYEVDGCELALSSEDGLPVPTGRDGTPAGFSVLATSPARLWSREELPSRYASEEAGDLEAAAEAVFGDASPEHVARLSHNHAVMGAYTRGGTVFTAGTTEWVYGLAGGDAVIEKITRNVLSRLA